MDVTSAASTLCQQLVALHNSDTTVSQLDKQLHSLGQQSMMSVIEENQSHHLRLLLRVSVTEGVRETFQQYSTAKWAQVQNTARSIKSSLEVNDAQELLMVAALPPLNARSSMDKAAGEWTSIVCKLSRHE